MISAALVAALVGYGSTIALVLAAAQALGATPAETASWVFAICIAKAAGSALLSGWLRVPVILAWSTPGAALIAASEGVTMAEGVGAFILAGVLILLTGLVGPLGRLIAAIPGAVASAMLAGVLLPFCLKLAPAADSRPLLILPVIATFAVMRLWHPAVAVLAALAAGLALAFGMGTPLPHGPYPLPMPLFIAPDWSAGALIGLGLPLYLVTMASQNLAGFAVLKGAGFDPPVRPALTVSGAISALMALFGAHTINMAAITAAICLGDDVHPDRSQRWKVGLPYAVVWVGLGLFGSVILATLAALPAELIAAIVGLALLTPLMGALAGGFADPATRFPAAVTLIVTGSGVSVLGVGAAFWGLAAGLLALFLERLRA